MRSMNLTQQYIKFQQFLICFICFSIAMWKKILAAVLGVIVGYSLIDDFNPGL